MHYIHPLVGLYSLRKQNIKKKGVHIVVKFYVNIVDVTPDISDNIKCEN